MRPRVVDLSQIMYYCMPVWPTQPNFLFEQTGNVPRDGHTMHTIRQMTTHTGTHIDTPLHFIAGGKSVEQIPIDDFVGEGLVIDLSHKKPKEEITVGDLKAHGKKIKDGDVLMLHTGWGRKIGYSTEFLFEWPYLVEETAKFVVDRKVKALGVDTLSVEGWKEKVPGHPPIAKGLGGETHRILLGAGIILVEALTNLDKVLAGQSSQRALFIYAPIAIKGAEGGPCRALALIYE